ncbi:hypothetical protein I6F48_12425 [Pseudoalteromonas sp. SWYJ118]|uniref:S8 family serine peptidase n=1 Tax=Pseudoalteromonas sp. SWYJ118 TaxID=2792062 RepID=UPI0018CF0E74|nr:hypothetical protein [Pseudoalteromonas sp. SWYJ118]MBH0076357.1 hypothetical protein [Pseudoalteromonas sp. SWYJ118]
MKINKLIVLSTAACISLSASANTSFDERVQLPKKQVSSVKYTKADFGSYKVERNLRLVPSSVVADEHVVMQKGDMAVVDVASKSDLVTKGTLVRNVLTNSLSSLSGNITVLLKDGITASDVAAAAGLKVVSVFPGTKIAVLAVNDGQDILVAAEQLNASGYAKEARIEVLETIYTAQ